MQPVEASSRVIASSTNPTFCHSMAVRPIRGLDPKAIGVYTIRYMQNVQNVSTRGFRTVIVMERTIGVTKARDEFRKLVDQVQYQGDKYVIERHGVPAVAVVPVEVYENWKQQRQRLLELIHEVQAANPDAYPEEVMQDVLEAQQDVRQSGV